MVAAMTTAIEQKCGCGQVSTSALVDTNALDKRSSRRRWPEELKRRIVAETFAPGASVSVVARRHDLNANQLFAWRRHYAGGHAEARLVPVEVPQEAGRVSNERPAGPATIAIDLPGGICVRVCGAVEAHALRQVMEALR
jgi:transposase